MIIKIEKKIGKELGHFSKDTQTANKARGHGKL
jgi:hypothetical protein